MLKAMKIPDDLLHKGTAEIPKDHTLDRLKACLKHHLEEGDYLPCERAISMLHAINTVRYSQQHANQHDLSRAFSRLALPFPPSSWSEAWDGIRTRTIGALGIIREKVRILSQLKCIIDNQPATLW
jgi:hypothetical protein